MRPNSITEKDFSSNLVMLIVYKVVFIDISSVILSNSTISFNEMSLFLTSRGAPCGFSK